MLVPDRESRPTALGLARCLGRAGVPVIAVSPRRGTPTWCSRHVTRRGRVPLLAADPERWLSGLIECVRDLPDKPVLFASADEHVWAVHQHRDELSRHFRYPFLNEATLRACIDKREMYRACQAAGIETGQVLSVTAAAHRQDVPEGTTFPSVLKPAAWVNLSNSRGHRHREFQHVFGQKALSIANRTVLDEALARAAHLRVPLLLQEEVPGPASAIHHVSLYADKNSNVRGVFVARKCRQYPSRFGNACMVQTEACDEAADLAARVVRAVGFHGIAGAIEFKRHPATGRLHFLEINPRAASSVAATEASGVNLPYLAYLEAIGAEMPPSAVSRVAVRWIDARRDVLYWLSYRRGDHTGQALPLREYLRTLRGRREYAYWAVRDPLPAIVQAAGLPRAIWQAVKS